MPFPETPRLPAMSPTYMLGCQSWNQRSPQMTTRADGRMQATPVGPASVQAARGAWSRVYALDAVGALDCMKHMFVGLSSVTRQNS